MDGKRWKAIAESLKDDEEMFVFFYTKEEADEELQRDQDTDEVFSVDEWLRIVESLDSSNYINHAVSETFFDIVSEAIKERKGNGNRK